MRLLDKKKTNEKRANVSLRDYTSVNAENLGDFREFFGRKVPNSMFWKIENIFGYI